jgi:cytochrome c553
MRVHAILGVLATGIFVCAAAGAQEVTPDVQQAAARLAATTCSTCHGTDGRNTSPAFPNLAAQTAPYLEAQLQAFRDQTRADPDAQAYMWGMAAQLSDPMIKAIAAHYSAKGAAAGVPGDAKLMARGKLIFQQGVVEQGIPPCATCHGDQAQGNGAFPRLAGQHAPYLLKQMLVIQNALRAAPVMHGVIKQLSRDQMLAVASYLASIGASAPRNGR